MTPPFNFIDKFSSLFEGSEVPQRFAVWSGISCISAMLERRVWVDMNIFQVYPNMYVIFVADSGKMRKGTSLKMARGILSKVDPGPRIIAQKITPEALIDSIRIVRTDDPKKLLQEQCGGVVIVDELVTFLNSDSYQRGLGGLLIELWDCPDHYEYRTRGRPVEEINFGHLSLLSATTCHHLRDAVPIQALGDGFSSRVVFVYEDRVPKPVPRPMKVKGFKALEEELILHLQRVSTMEGPITLSPESIEFFDEEYRRFYHSDFYNDERLGSYASRRDKHLLKVAMCLVAAEGSSTVIELNHLILAKELLTDLENRLDEVFDRISMTEVGSSVEHVFNAIAKAEGGMITRSDLLKKFSYRMDAKDLERVIQTLIISKRVRVKAAAGAAWYQVVKEKE